MVMAVIAARVFVVTYVGLVLVDGEYLSPPHRYYPKDVPGAKNDHFG
jgi:hypothetical protein